MVGTGMLACEYVVLFVVVVVFVVFVVVVAVVVVVVVVLSIWGGISSTIYMLNRCM